MVKVFVIVILSQFLGHADIFNPEKWKIDSIPVPLSKKWYEANWSKEEFEVSFENGTLTIREPHKPWDNKIVVEAETLLASDQGEWGGGLYQYFKNKGGSRIIKKGNFHTIFSYNGKTFVLESDYLGRNQGKIWRLSLLNGIWHTEEYIGVKDSPFTYCFKNNHSIYLVTDEKFLDVDLEKEKVLPIVENAFWGAMFPNSIAKESDQVQWIGMRGGIVRLERTNPVKLTWYTKKVRGKK